MTDRSEQSWQAWRASRLAAVQEVPGNLALIAYQPVTETPAPVDGIAGASVRREADGSGVLLTATVDLGVTVDGVPVDGETFVARTGPDKPNHIRHGRLWMDVFSLDGSHDELRIYDEGAENLAEFRDIEVYDFDPTAVVDGRFVTFESIDRVPWEFTRSTDTGHTKRVPGAIVAEVAGVEYRLSAFLDGENLVLVFADGTTGAESYAPGRFLQVPAPSDDGRTVLDLNRAFIPPCGFSDHYSCPVPPPHNRLGTPIRAGERRVSWRTPRT